MSTMSYGMFSDEGNQQIADIIEFHKMQKSPWHVVLQNLHDLAESDYEKFGEAMDTVVRESVYCAIGADVRGEEFYC